MNGRPSRTTGAARAPSSDHSPVVVAAVVIGAVAILVSGWVHFYLYFRGGYRGIAPDDVLGITISRAFVVNAIAAVVIAELLVISLLRPRLLVPAALAGIGFGVATLVAYFLSRTRGVLGFKETATTTEAVIGMVAEIVAIAALTVAIAGITAARRRADGRGVASPPESPATAPVRTT